MWVNLSKDVRIPVRPGVHRVKCELRTVDPLLVSLIITKYFTLKKVL